MSLLSSILVFYSSSEWGHYSVLFLHFMVKLMKMWILLITLFILWHLPQLRILVAFLWFFSCRFWYHFHSSILETFFFAVSMTPFLISIPIFCGQFHFRQSFKSQSSKVVSSSSSHFTEAPWKISST